VVASVLDGGCRDEWSHHCQHAYLSALTAARCLHSPSCIPILVSGEPWSVQALDLLAVPSVVLHTSTAPALLPALCPSLYLPVAVTSFSERSEGALARLFRPIAAVHPIDQWLSREFCAYLYFRCDRPEREAMFDLLATARSSEPTALGVCKGTAPRDQTAIAKRFAASWHDDAVHLYSKYRFVVAFENSVVDGYITEKILNAMLADAIPIYFGPKQVKSYFNPDAFIDCGDFDSLRECASFVARVDANASLLSSYLSAPRISEQQADELFSAVPEVGSLSFASRLRGLLVLHAQQGEGSSD
jgi:hypothetical protein